MYQLPSDHCSDLSNVERAKYLAEYQLRILTTWDWLSCATQAEINVATWFKVQQIEGINRVVI